jgi:p-cymene monooxygenase electron transfer component
LHLGGAPFPYVAGQAALLGLPDRTDRAAYSIASAPEETLRDGYLEFLIKLESGSTWGAHLAGVARGRPVDVEGPLGAFTFPARGAPAAYLFVAGGTGIAPLRSMIWHAILSEQRPRLHLLYSARTPADFAYLPELRGLARRGKLELSLTATREVPAGWRGHRGRITPARLAPLIETPETLCFVCGPASMVHDVPVMLTELGIERGRIRVEEW